jgi:hypothetical protein
LELELGPLEEFLKQYLANPVDPNKIQKAKDAQLYVDKANLALHQRKVQNAWALYYEAELLEYELKTKEELDARAGKILFESAILLNDGAKQNVRRLIGQGSDNGGWVLQKNVASSNVIEARRIIQDYYIKKYTYLDVAMQMPF